MPESMKDYKTQIADLLDKYEDGRDIFIKNEWEATLKLKPGIHGENLTDNWLVLMEQVTGIIAKSKYGLDTYENEIQILDAEQMLDIYVSTGMPDNYTHWSYGKQRQLMGEAHARGQMGLAYEMVINSNPSISYCMTSNTKTMMALVIAHAAQGHNAFFKNNVLYKQFTNADEIRGDLKRLANFVSECEEKYGVTKVERILDACHALEYYAFDYTSKPVKKSKKQIEAHETALEEARRDSMDAVLEATSLRPKNIFKSVSNDHHDRPLKEQNLLRYIGNAAPHLETWERQIINMFCDRAQYFYPQFLDKLSNEGFASYWDYKIMHDLHDEKLIDDGMFFEFIESHSAVLNQMDFSSFNPYTLGFAIYMDLDRMCQNPTQEDRKWFPEIAGNPDWLAVHKKAAYNYSDETFIYQFLSPKVMRDFHMFVLKDDDQEEDQEITAIHDEDGYKKIRAALAETYNLAHKLPHIEVAAYDYKGDRTLTLRHIEYNRKPLAEEDTLEVLKHIINYGDILSF